MSTHLHSKDSLIAAWQAISPSQPLSDELQDLLLMFLNKPKSEVVQMDQRAVSSRPSTILNKEDCNLLPAPQRFQRRRTTSHGQSTVPQGPAIIFDIAPAKTSRRAEAAFDSLLITPLGPVDTSDDSTIELGLAFAAVHTT